MNKKRQRTAFRVFCTVLVFLFAAAQTLAQQGVDPSQGYVVDAQNGWAPNRQLSPLNVPVAGQAGGATTPSFGQQILRGLFPLGAPTTANRRSFNGRLNANKAYNDFRIADDESKRAYQYGQTAHYGSDSRTRYEAAEQAQYCAQRAKQASDRVYDAAKRGDPTARAYYSQTKLAADRAQDDADRARSDADYYR